ncbi:hypothetical protein H310_08125 [Aphanomyces invadans]|uniref:Uncharacterized protein n=1 Tax=Aphanomyces invadans TaxID=157072 RepID=A0A024TZM1_9STRA|nr:hypothetical protein H310_08125 [Aphanomyces invadans]ETV99433.1 hypothetical protein H310_08125 [Aphanomyces invadans]RHY27543.1 hypothetical protein DYB32_006710 [Aphanomyces invadans]|eukprot:XP_008871989.1 hypothetical protein H310_08125 [Aphanomyces invadans]
MSASSSVLHCVFKGCPNVRLSFTDKCAFHKSRSKCCVQDCPNMVYARNRCVRHGGKKTCQVQGCGGNVRGGDWCTKHGGHIVKRYCTTEGCTKQAHAQQKCVSHGGGRYCRAPGCSQHIRVGGFCNQHQPSKSPPSSPTSTSTCVWWESVLHALYVSSGAEDLVDDDDLTWVDDFTAMFV